MSYQVYILSQRWLSEVKATGTLINSKVIKNLYSPENNATRDLSSPARRR
ncbi:hypothetical protein [Pseudanabaena sp. BC1403]|nr:hypothetical protein [Pseudanabaena sp. BC1403]